jgi:hypothetical protein
MLGLGHVPALVTPTNVLPATDRRTLVLLAHDAWVSTASTAADGYGIRAQPALES